MQEDRQWLKDLIVRAQKGDPHALQDLIREFYTHVYRTAYAVLHAEADSEDVTQEAWIKIARSLPSLSHPEAFITWITTIASRTALDHVRKTRRNTDLSFDETLLHHPAHHDLGSDLELQDALQRLTPEHRAILLLRERDGFDYAEIARILTIPLGTVKSRIAYARKAVRDAYHEGDDSLDNA